MISSFNLTPTIFVGLFLAAILIFSSFTHQNATRDQKNDQALMAKIDAQAQQ